MPELAVPTITHHETISTGAQNLIYNVPETIPTGAWMVVNAQYGHFDSTISFLDGFAEPAEWTTIRATSASFVFVRRRQPADWRFFFRREEGNSQTRAQVFAIEGADFNDPFEVFSSHWIDDQQQMTDLTVPGLTTGGEGRLVIALWGWMSVGAANGSSVSWTLPPEMTEFYSSPTALNRHAFALTTEFHEDQETIGSRSITTTPTSFVGMLVGHIISIAPGLDIEYSDIAGSAHLPIHAWTTFHHVEQEVGGQAQMPIRASRQHVWYAMLSSESELDTVLNMPIELNAELESTSSLLAISMGKGMGPIIGSPDVDPLGGPDETHRAVRQLREGDRLRTHIPYGDVRGDVRLSRVVQREIYDSIANQKLDFHLLPEDEEIVPATRGGERFRFYPPRRNESSRQVARSRRFIDRRSGSRDDSL